MGNRSVGGVLVISLSLAGPGCHWWQRGAAATVVGAAGGYAIGESMPCPYDEPGCDQTEQVPTWVAIMTLSAVALWGLAELSLLRARSNASAEYVPTYDSDDSPYVGSGGDEEDTTFDEDAEGSAEHDFEPVSFFSSATSLEQGLFAGEGQERITTSAVGYLTGDVPILACAHAKAEIFATLTHNCPSIHSHTSHLSSYTIFTGPCVCQFANGMTYCNASGEGLCSIDESNTSTFAYAQGQGVDRELVEQLAQSNATYRCAIGHDIDQGTFDCAEESGSWICFAHAQCTP